MKLTENAPDGASVNDPSVPLQVNNRSSTPKLFTGLPSFVKKLLVIDRVLELEKWYYNLPQLERDRFRFLPEGDRGDVLKQVPYEYAPQDEQLQYRPANLLRVRSLKALAPFDAYEQSLIDRES